MKQKTTIIMTREYEDKALVYTKTEIIRTKDAIPAEKDTKFEVRGIVKSDD
jgi:hypothetical protein